MSFKQQTCPHCFAVYEFYQRQSIIPNCPHCGAYANGWAPMDSDTFYETHGRDTKEKTHESHQS